MARHGFLQRDEDSVVRVPVLPRAWPVIMAAESTGSRKSKESLFGFLSSGLIATNEKVSSVTFNIPPSFLASIPGMYIVMKMRFLSWPHLAFPNVGLIMLADTAAVQKSSAASPSLITAAPRIVDQQPPC